MYVFVIGTSLQNQIDHPLVRQLFRIPTNTPAAACIPDNQSRCLHLSQLHLPLLADMHKYHNYVAASNLDWTTVSNLSYVYSISK